MHLVLFVFATVCIIGGFFGLAMGAIPTIILWALAGLLIFGGWKARPNRLRRREDRLAAGGPETPPHPQQ